MYELVLGAVSTAGLAIGGWAALQVIKVPSLEEDVRYIRERVDALYDHIIDREGFDQGRGRPR